VTDADNKWTKGTWTKGTKIEVDGVELTVKQAVVKKRVYINVTRIVGRDRKRKLDISAGVETEMEDALDLVTTMQQVAKMQTARCTCDYRYGFSDHAEHCRSIYVAKEYRDEDD
jgi:hypothetical protein